MSRFILRHRSGRIPQKDLAGLRQSPDIQIVDESPRMLLVEASKESLQPILNGMGDWTMSPEVEYKAPSPRPKIRGR